MRKLSGALALFALIAACSSSSKSGSGTGAAKSLGAATPIASQDVGPAGGTVTGGDVTITNILPEDHIRVTIFCLYITAFAL